MTMCPGHDRPHSRVEWLASALCDSSPDKVALDSFLKPARNIKRGLRAEEDQKCKHMKSGGVNCPSCNQEMPACTLPIDAVAKAFASSDMAALGIKLCCLPPDKLAKGEAGHVLRHCVFQIKRMICLKGDTVAVFKIGISATLAFRFRKYRDENFESMHVVHMSNNLGEVDMLEAALIDSFIHRQGCRNVALGGNGPLRLSKFSPPYFCYVVGARADKACRIGG